MNCPYRQAGINRSISFFIATSRLTRVSPEYVALGSKLRAEVFAHIQIAGNRVAAQLSSESIGQGGAMYFTDITSNLHVVARYRSGEVTGCEVALMRPHQMIARLLDVKRVFAAAIGEVDMDG